MSGRRKVCLLPCLVIVSVFFYTQSFVNDLVLRPSDDRSRLLAEDAILAACGSVRDAMSSLLQPHEYHRRTAFERSAMGTKLERLQTSLDHIHRDAPLHNTTQIQAPSGLSVEWRYTADIHHLDLCGTLAGKRITMIGGEHIYNLHLLLLQHRERSERKLFPCPYHEFCTHHHICLAYHRRDDVPLARYIKPPTTQELIETESAVVNYIVSDTLLSVPDEHFWAYTLPFVDPTTSVRLRETYWLAAARKANVVILGRGPTSAPGSTYTGNWSFLDDIPDYVDESRAASATEFGNQGDESTSRMVPRSLEILNAAVHLTVSRFLPDLFQLLQSIREEIRPSRRRRLIWPSIWYRLPGRGAARTTLLRLHAPSKLRDVVQQAFVRNRPPRSSAEHVFMLQLLAFINADATNTARLEDPWTLLFNAQVYLQNMVLRELLPRYGIVFLPLDVPWVEGVQARGRGREYSDGPVEVDIKRTTAIGEAFLKGIDYILRYLE